MVNPVDVIYAMAVLIGALVVGYLFVELPLVRKSFLPASVAAGLFLLIMGPELLGKVSAQSSIGFDMYEIWAPLPGLLISAIFASLFLARPIISLKGMWKAAAPQAAFGQMIAWGYYMIGGIVTLCITIPFFGARPLSAALLEISFEGGHGTAAGMIPVFKEFYYQNAHQMAIALATTSLLATLICGLLLIQYGKRRGLIGDYGPIQEIRGMIYHRRVIHELHKKGVSLREELGVTNVISHLLLIAVSIFFGWVIHSALLFLEAFTWGQNGVKIFGYMPLFTFCMFGGILGQMLWRKMKITISRPLVDLMSGIILSILVTSAIATMKLGFVAEDGMTFLVLALSGIVWVIFSFLVMARFMFPKHWFTNAIVSVGQSMGTTATGLLFGKIVDPKDRTGVVESFGYKQLMFAPLVGGGVVTALAIPMIILMGLPAFTIVCGLICLTWGLIGVVFFHPR